MSLKVTLDRSELLDVLGFLSVASRVGSSDPSVVMIFARKGKLYFRSTDHFLYLEASIPIKTAAKGDKTLSVLDPMISFVSGSKSSKVSIEIGAKEVKLQSSESKASLKTLDATSFSGWPEMSDAKIKKCGEDLLDAIKAVRFCASPDMVAPELYNVHVKGADGKLLVESADGHRLGKVFLDNVSGDVDTMIPLRAVMKIPALDGRSAMCWNKNFLSFISSNKGVLKSVICRTSYGAYPDTDGIVPKKFSTNLSIDKSELVRLLQAAVPFSDQNYRGVEIFATSGGLKVRAKSDGMGDFLAVAKLKSFKGKDINIIVDAKTVLDFVSGTSGTVSMGFNSKVDPFRIKDSDKEGFVYVVWPLVRNTKSEPEEEE